MNRPRPKYITHPEFIILLIIGLAVGLFLAKDYGQSWDEYLHEVYAQHTVEMYLGQRAPGDTIVNLKHYGPAFIVVWYLLRNLLYEVVPVLNYTEAGHIIYWLAFIPAPILIYDLALRLAGRKAALASALLFATQPVIFGYVFINPKDPPFMTAMIASVWLGLWASDLLVNGDPPPELNAIRSESNKYLRSLLNGWKANTRLTRIILGLLWFIFLTIVVDSLTTHYIFDEFNRLVSQAYEGSASWPIQQLFNQVAQDKWKTPLSMYLEKTRILYLTIRFLFYIGGSTVLVYLSAHVLGSPIRLRSLYRARGYWSWIVAAILLGICTSIRVFGPFAGVLASVYLLIRSQGRAWRVLVVYWCLALLTTYITWPTLWTLPIQNLFETVSIMSKFKWEGYVLYEYVHYLGTQLPWHFVPRLISLRLTLPSLILGIFGIGLAVIEIAKRSVRSSLLLLMVAWFLFPLAAVLVLDANIYSAFRQMMFIIPGLFILTSLVFDRIFHKLEGALWVPLVVGLAIAPGVSGIAQLHPYEIIYFNELTRGVAGAVGRFYVNAGGTEYREAIEYINQIAPENALVLINSREHHTMTPFAREDLKLARLDDEYKSNPPPGAFIVGGGIISPQAEELYTIERGEVTLLTISRIPSGH